MKKLFISCIIGCTVLFGATQAFANIGMLNYMPVKQTIPMDKEHLDLLKRECDKYGLDINLVLGVIATESNYDSQAISSTNDYGLFQINKVNLNQLTKIFGEINLLNEDDNIRAGVYLLNQNRQYWINQGYSDEDVFSLMLISYHRGQKGAEGYISRHGIRSDYVNKVLENKNRLEVNQ